MTTLAQFLAQLDVVLKANAPGGTKVDRDRTDAYGLEEVPCINVLAHNVDRTPLGSGVDDCQVEVELRMYVRGADCTLAAEALHATVHTPLINDTTLRALADSIQLPSQQFERQAADQTSLIKSARYRITYSADRGAL